MTGFWLPRGNITPFGVKSLLVAICTSNITLEKPRYRSSKNDHGKIIIAFSSPSPVLDRLFDYFLIHPECMKIYCLPLHMLVLPQFNARKKNILIQHKNIYKSCSIINIWIRIEKYRLIFFTKCIFFIKIQILVSTLAFLYWR